MAKLTENQERRLREMLRDYDTLRGWDRNSQVLGYLVGLGWSAPTANRMLGELLSESFFDRKE